MNRQENHQDTGEDRKGYCELVRGAATPPTQSTEYETGTQLWLHHVALYHDSPGSETVGCLVKEFLPLGTEGRCLNSTGECVIVPYMQ